MTTIVANWLSSHCSWMKSSHCSCSLWVLVLMKWNLHYIRTGIFKVGWPFLFTVKNLSPSRSTWSAGTGDVVRHSIGWNSCGRAKRMRVARPVSEVSALASPGPFVIVVQGRIGNWWRRSPCLVKLARYAFTFKPERKKVEYRMCYQLLAWPERRRTAILSETWVFGNSDLSGQTETR